MTMNKNLVSLRDHIGDILAELGKDNKEIVVLDNDLAGSTTSINFAKVHPERFYELGIAEQSGMSIAHGLSSEGKVPFYVNFAIFSTGTTWTQLRQICYSNANVKIIGTHTGIDNGPDGATHHALEDLALTRSLANLKVLIPANTTELKSAIEYASKVVGPVYIRVARGVVQDYEPALPVDMSKADLVKDGGTDVALIFEGTSGKLALESYEVLKDANINARLVNLRSIKPVDEENIVNMIKDCDSIITIENHATVGGVASLVSELLVKNRLCIPLEKVGIEDTFTESGQLDDIKKKYGLHTDNVLAKAKSLLNL